MALGGMNTRQAIKLARALGCRIEPNKGTAEIRIHPPDGSRHVTMKGTRKDAPRVLTVMIRRLQRKL